MTYHHILAQRAMQEGREPDSDAEIQEWFWDALHQRFPQAMKWLAARVHLFRSQEQTVQQWDFPAAGDLGREIEKILGVDLLRQLLQERLGIAIQYVARGELQVAQYASSLPALPLDKVDVSQLFSAYPAAAAELQAMAAEANLQPNAVITRAYQPNRAIAREMQQLLTVMTRRQAISRHLGCMIGWLHCCEIKATISGTITATWPEQYNSQALLDPAIDC